MAPLIEQRGGWWNFIETFMLYDTDTPPFWISYNVN